MASHETDLTFFTNDKHGTLLDQFKAILPHLGDLTPITDDMSEEKKLAIIQREFDRRRTGALCAGFGRIQSRAADVAGNTQSCPARQQFRFRDDLEWPPLCLSDIRMAVVRLSWQTVFSATAISGAGHCQSEAKSAGGRA